MPVGTQFSVNDDKSCKKKIRPKGGHKYNNNNVSEALRVQRWMAERREVEGILKP